MGDTTTINVDTNWQKFFSLADLTLSFNNEGPSEVYVRQSSSKPLFDQKGYSYMPGNGGTGKVDSDNFWVRTKFGNSQFHFGITGPISFNPNLLSELTLWLDADDSDTITESGGAVSKWDDKSGNSNDAEESIGAFQPFTNLNTIGGLNAISWDIDDDSLIIQSSSSINAIWKNGATIFIVSKSNSLGGGGFGRIFSGGWDFRKRGTGGGTLNFQTPFSITEARFESVGGTYIPGSSVIIGLTYDASNTTNVPIFYKDGNVVDHNIVIVPAGIYTETTENIIVGNVNSGGSRAFDGDFGEIIIYKRILDDNERIQVETYLTNKWSFNPKKLLGLSLWLDANDGSTIIESGGAVSEWDDKSQNGFNLIQPTASAKPKTNSVTINGLNAIDFDGVDDYLFNDVDSDLFNIINGNYTVFYVLDLRDITSPDCIISWNKTTVPEFNNTIYCYTNAQLFLGIDVLTQTLISVDLSNTLQLITLSSNFNNEIITRLNGIEQSTRSINIPNLGVDMFGLFTEFDVPDPGNFINGAMGELIIYNRLLTSDEIDQVETYLLDKWGIT